MKNILLVEPGYRNKYPPLGLMKISAYHKLRGDYVLFVKGCDKKVALQRWDRIYVSTLFTFYWDITLKTINFYRNSVDSPENIIAGGIMATLLGKEIRRETGIRVISGLLDKPGLLDTGNKYNIDALIPDYQMLNEIEYDYGLNDAYITYATRGCPNRCGFCAVHRIEPSYVHYLPIKKQIKGIDEIYGPRHNLILMDNNVLASEKFERIINDIIDLGFYRGATFAGRKRYVDFNQGTDADFLNLNKMALLAKAAIKPLRIAFDNIAMKDVYISKIKMARDNGILNLSNYVLFNYRDTPADFFERLKINILLNQEIGTKIYSFPMKYVPLDAKNRSYVGRHWNKKLLRGIQCVLIATRGLIGTQRDFFEAAFGSTYDDFMRILYMPEKYIINRATHQANGAIDWRDAYDKLTKNQKNEFIDIVSKNKVIKEDIAHLSSLKLKRLLSHYL